MFYLVPIHKIKRTISVFTLIKNSFESIEQAKEVFLAKKHQLNTTDYDWFVMKAVNKYGTIVEWSDK